ncbi:ADP-dependent phosphofructokinase/glucokinase-like protein [uncultured Pleomorphomonas sp.]|uniref:ADP-dependent phosphofructokinase/glucokinase-like protein n=1 Tax=uncultured Pleomorphomonas sp. TaxID=442121 RepID=A0A212LEN9_9HYPH|nr:ADP-dependent glucokinase/phosphofructokinase [uncultured Pleomorphomonas sp.]SCM76036.1 ADP-dependent phosphofructokinase/glucokinase-like protein [uncultured Pleomorphomonas sp.]
MMNSAPTIAVTPIDWAGAYDRLAAELPALVTAATTLVTGFAACLDRRIDLHAVAPALAERPEAGARRLFAELMARARAGRGGELLVDDWPDGAAFLDPHTLPDGMAIGGTSAQAAWTLAAIGAPSLLALGEAGPEELAALHAGIGLAESEATLGSPRHRRPARRSGPAHYIVEYTAGRPLPGLVPERSTRVIVRFADEALQEDAMFDRWVAAHGTQLRVGLLSSPNAVPLADLPPALARLAAAARAWRRAGLSIVHLELGDYPWPGTLGATLAGLAPEVTSIGLNQNELRGLVPGDDPLAQADELSHRLGVDRLVVHADGWALAVTRSDAGVELDALAMGCLLAAARAEAGRPSSHPRVPRQASFGPLPVPPLSSLPDGRRVACVAAPYLERPASTVGLGDSFTAGCLLVHSNARHQPVVGPVGLPAGAIADTDPRRA